MDAINFILRVISLLFIVMVLTKLFMVVADYVGKEFRIGDLVINSWHSVVTRITSKHKR